MNGRIAQLDALRGMAALLVVLQHLTTIIALHPQAPLLFRAYNDYFNHYLLSPGRIGVVAFFVTSGFVVPYSLSEKGSVRQFIASRFFRLYPAYWVSLALALVVFTMVFKLSYSTPTVLANVTMMQGALGFDNVIPAYWTLLYELVFYVICVVLFLKGWLSNPKSILVVVFLLVFGAFVSAFLRRFGHFAPPIGLFLFLSIMYLGVLFRLSFEKNGVIFDKYSKSGIAIILLLSPAINFVAYFGYPKIEDWLSAATGVYLGIGLFIYALQYPLSNRKIILKIGLVSYSFYLLHDIPMQLAKLYFYNVNWPIAAFLIPAATIGVTFGLAFLSFKFIETPLQIFGKRAWRKSQPKERET